MPTADLSAIRLADKIIPAHGGAGKVKDIMDPKFAQPQNVTTAEIIKFFSGTGVDPKCPSCNKGSTSIQVDETQQQVRVVVNEYVEVQSSGGFVRTSNLMHPAILTSCDNCGYIRTFSLHKVNTWLNAQDPSRSKPE